MLLSIYWVKECTWYGNYWTVSTPFLTLRPKTVLRIAGCWIFCVRNIHKNYLISSLFSIFSVFCSSHNLESCFQQVSIFFKHRSCKCVNSLLNNRIALIDSSFFAQICLFFSLEYIINLLSLKIHVVSKLLEHFNTIFNAPTKLNS